MNIPQVAIKDYTYDLDPKHIAQYPLEERDKSKLLFYNRGVIEDRLFKDLPHLLPENACLVFNNTKVIAARLLFLKPTGARIEFFLLEPSEPTDPQLALTAKNGCVWKCMVGNLKRLNSADVLSNSIPGGSANEVFKAQIERVVDDEIFVKFEWNSEHTFSEIIQLLGHLPIPPYLNRRTEQSDYDRYQTTYSSLEGAVAAPTAGLHFTEQTFTELKQLHIPYNFVTLHVGAGTFKPVKSKTLDAHDMHRELMIVSKEVLVMLFHEAAIIPIGTTSLRSLESLYWLAVLINKKQVNLDAEENFLVPKLCPYNLNADMSRKEALELLLNLMEKLNISTLIGYTEILIMPGYNFKMTDGLVTNFHQPESTLLVLIDSLIGENWRKVYQHAIKENYRFFSYGDSSLLIP